jgi:hypothetical protein
MTLHYTTASNVLPENKMRMYPTKVINIIGGPGCDKSLFSSAIILRLNLRHKSALGLHGAGFKGFVLLHKVSSAIDQGIPNWARHPRHKVVGVSGGHGCASRAAIMASAYP